MAEIPGAGAAKSAFGAVGKLLPWAIGLAVVGLLCSPAGASAMTLQNVGAGLAAAPGKLAAVFSKTAAPAAGMGSTALPYVSTFATPVTTVAAAKGSLASGAPAMLTTTGAATTGSLAANAPALSLQ